jgi:hypothetical protein
LSIKVNYCEHILPVEYNNWMQCPRYIPIDSQKRSQYSTTEVNNLSYSFVSSIIIQNTRNKTGDGKITDVLQKEEKTAQPEAGWLQAVAYK